MAIVLDSIDGETNRGKKVTLFSDTKAEVPQTAAATIPLVEGLPKDITALAPGCIMYTASLEVAALKSDGNWNWS